MQGGRRRQWRQQGCAARARRGQARSAAPAGSRRSAAWAGSGAAGRGCRSAARRRGRRAPLAASPTAPAGSSQPPARRWQPAPVLQRQLSSRWQTCRPLRSRPQHCGRCCRNWAVLRRLPTRCAGGAVGLACSDTSGSNQSLRMHAALPLWRQGCNASAAVLFLYLQMAILRSLPAVRSYFSSTR